MFEKRDGSRVGRKNEEEESVECEGGGDKSIRMRRRRGRREEGG